MVRKEIIILLVILATGLFLHEKGTSAKTDALTLRPPVALPFGTGIRKRIEDLFNSGVTQDLAVAGWTKKTGTGVILEDGAGNAFTTSTGFGIKAHYSINNSRVSLKRWLKFQVKTLNSTAFSGGFIGISGTSRLTYAAVFTKQNGANDDFSLETVFESGPPTQTAIGSLAGNGTLRTIKIIARGGKVWVDIDNGALTGGPYTVGTIAPNSAPGLYYVGPTFGLGNATTTIWKNFEVREYPY